MKVAVETMKGEISELKSSYAEWESKFKNQADAFTKDKKQISDHVAELLKKKAALEQFIEDEIEEMNQQLADIVFISV